MFIYTISNDIYHDKALKPSVVTIRRLPNDKEAIHNNIGILIVYWDRYKNFCDFFEMVFLSCTCFNTLLNNRTHMLRTRVRTKKLFTDERKLKWSPSYDKWINQMFWWSWTYIHTESDWIPLFDFCIRNWHNNLIHQ